MALRTQCADGWGAGRPTANSGRDSFVNSHAIKRRSSVPPANALRNAAGSAARR